ncbi:MAG TPA: protein-glutamate O-methyltransferase CheR [Bacteroidales bacterium]|jgi:two-component system CheB/CheR fusion protein|nr:protein-glutamate O-methyltransferase CheR [Bacteroidales bacterium]HOL97958.1 protein-glutamate O-methyltransferase CheR [Bacteroidales bacterium]
MFKNNIYIIVDDTGLGTLREFFGYLSLKINLNISVFSNLKITNPIFFREILHSQSKLEITDDFKDFQNNSSKIYANDIKFFNSLVYSYQNSNADKNFNCKCFLLIFSNNNNQYKTQIDKCKEAGFIVIATEQSKCIINTIDYILGPEKVLKKIYQIILRNVNDRNDKYKKLFEENQEIIIKILNLVKQKYNFDYRAFKENTIIRRIEKRMSLANMNFESYYNFISESEKEKDLLYKEFLIGVTEFFRNKEIFETFKEKVVPKICENSENEIRVWTAACSTGEEAYTVAIVIYDYMQQNSIKKELKIFATDIDLNALKNAGDGIYSVSSVENVPEYYREKYFIQKNGNYKIDEKLRKLIIFAFHDVINDPPFIKIDFLSCRNLFIYLKPEIQTKVLSNFRFSLKQNGFLMLGISETIGEMNKYFEAYDYKIKIFRRI